MKKSGSNFPMGEINSYFGQARKTVMLEKQHLDDSRLRYIILNLIYVEMNGVNPFNVRYKNNEPHIDHIYPKSVLKNLGHPSDQINNIGNYRYVGASDNKRKRAELPDSHFYRLKAQGIDLRRHLLVDYYADHPEQMKLSNYNDFKTRRLDSIFQIVSNIVNK
jgi:hypothetical protein